MKEEMTESDRQFLLNALFTATETYTDIAKAATDDRFREQFKWQAMKAKSMSNKIEQADRITLERF